MSADADVEGVTYDDLSKRQQNDYQNRVTEGARMVKQGIITIEDCDPSLLLDDSEEPADALVERFQSTVDAKVDELETPEERRAETRERTSSTTDPTEIDWPRLWTECNLDPQVDSLSLTQLALAIDVSEQTPLTDADDTDAFVQRAVEAGLLAGEREYRPIGGKR